MRAALFRKLDERYAHRVYYCIVKMDQKGFVKLFSFRVDSKKIALALIGSAIQAFGLYNVHSFAGVTEGGVLGLTLLLNHWLNISPALSGFVINVICYLIGFKILGKEFIFYSAVGGGGFSLFYAVCEQFPPVWPNIAEHPLLAAVLGALFIGVGVGVCVRAGGAPGGDDALAMSIHHVTHLEIQWVYLFFDLVVLGLSISYIPLKRLIYSLLTVVLSGQIIGWMQKIKLPEKKNA